MKSNAAVHNIISGMMRAHPCGRQYTQLTGKAMTPEGSESDRYPHGGVLFLYRKKRVDNFISRDAPDVRPDNSAFLCPVFDLIP